MARVKKQSTKKRRNRLRDKRKLSSKPDRGISWVGLNAKPLREILPDVGKACAETCVETCGYRALFDVVWGVIEICRLTSEGLTAKQIAKIMTELSHWLVQKQIKNLKTRLGLFSTVQLIRLYLAITNNLPCNFWTLRGWNPIPQALMV